MAVGVSVEKREGPNHHHAQSGRKGCLGGYQPTQCQDRYRDGQFRAGHVNPGDSEDSTENHDTDKGQRDLPDRPSTLLRRPKADREHGQEMVPSGQGMHQTVLESVGSSRQNVGRGQVRQEYKQRRGQQSFNGDFIHNNIKNFVRSVQ